MDLKVYRFVAHFGAASDGGVISWARRPPLRGLAPALGESRRADCGRRVRAVAAEYKGLRTFYCVAYGLRRIATHPPPHYRKRLQLTI